MLLEGAVLSDDDIAALLSDDVEEADDLVQKLVSMWTDFD